MTGERQRGRRAAGGSGCGPPSRGEWVQEDWGSATVQPAEMADAGGFGPPGWDERVWDDRDSAAVQGAGMAPAHGSGPSRWGERLRDDRGSATVLVAGMAVALMVVTLLGLQVGGAVLTRHQVEAAADQAALAAAGQVLAGADRACERARWVADRMSVTTTACRVVGWEAYVEVTARLPGWAVLSGTANAHARAGPAEVPGG